MTQKSTMTATLNLVNDLKFVATTGRGHTTVLHPGENGTAPSPMEYMVMGVAGCASVDVVQGLRDAGERLFSLSTEITAVRSGGTPNVFETMDVCFKIHGAKLNESTVQKIINDSHSKNCSAGIMMINGGVQVTFSYALDSVDC